MKIEPRQVEAFLKKPDPRIRGVVIYGNDGGLVAERAVALAKAICPDINDPFRVVDIAGEVLKHDPARLADEFGAMSMMGGRRVVRVRPAGEESVAALENLVAATAGDALIVVEGGNLTPRSGLRALAETEACLAAMPCYMDNEAALEGLVESAARAQGLTVDADALPWIVERLGGDRAQSRSEIEKLLLYKADDSNKTITLDDALAVLGDTADIGVDDVISATFDGELVALDRALDRVFAEGGKAVPLIVSLERHASNLHFVAGHAGRPGAIEAATNRIFGLPRFGPRREAFNRHVRLWPLARLGSVIDATLDADILCRTTDMPDQAIARRMCLAFARAAETARKRR
jgi:DNA polymerase-3 subunit delta